MSLHPHPIDPVPEPTARVAHAAFPKGSLAIRIRDELGVIYQDEQFAPLFPTRGQSAVAPWRLMLVTLLQQVVTTFNTGDTVGAWRAFSLEYVDHQKPAFIDTDGPEEFAAIVALARRSLPNLQVSIEDVIVEGDKLAARLRWHSADAQGRTIDRETIEILRFSNGRVAEHWGAEAWSMDSAAAGDPCVHVQG